MIELGELYAKESAQIAPIVPLLDKEAGLFEGALTAPIIGVKHGIDVAASALADASMPVLEKITPDSMNEWLEGQRKLAYESMKGTRVDPRTVGAVGQLGHALGSVLTMGAMGAPLGLPGSVAAIGTLSGYDKYKELLSQGVDETTAAKVAGVTGTVMGVGAALPPFLGGTLAKQIASGVGINVGLGITERVGSAALLEDKYPQIAQHYKALDKTAMAIDAILGAAFPLGARALRAYGKPTIEHVDDAMDANRLVVEQTRDPALQSTLEGLDRQQRIADDVSRQILEEGRPISDIEIPLRAMEDTIPNEQFGVIAARAAKAIDDLMVQENGTSLRDVETDIARMVDAFKGVDEAAEMRMVEERKKVEMEGEKPAPPPKAEEEISPDQFSRQEAKRIVDGNPDMKVVNDDGNVVNAKDLIEQAEMKFQQEKKEASLFKVAVACAIGVGE